MAAILAETVPNPPSARSLQRHFARQGLNRGKTGGPERAYGRFEAEAPNDLWTGDVLHGPVASRRKTYLFGFIDDFVRALVGYRFGMAEDTVRLEAALRAGLAAGGAPRALYVDNASPFVSGELIRACATLGIRLIHSAPGEPQGRVKIERVFRTVREQFLIEVAARGVADLAELNRLFAAWVEGVYHRRVHSETGLSPLDRFLSGGPPALPPPQKLREAFLWSSWRSVTRTATVSLHGNVYEIDAALAGQKVELLYDPFDLTRIEVRWQGRPMGLATPHRIGRHTHPKARPEASEQAPPRSGIDYLGIISARFEEQTRRRISYSGLSAEPQPCDETDPGKKEEQ